MLWGEIKKQCLQLGFMKERDYLKNKGAFFSSANWAQNQIALYVKPILRKQVINCRRAENVLQEKDSSMEMRLYEGKDISYRSLWAKAFSFQCDGNGKCIVEDDEGRREILLSSDKSFKDYRGFCKGHLKLTFTGDYGYLIKNVSAFGITFSDKEEDIPLLDDYISFDFKKIDEDFMGFCERAPIFKGEGSKEEREISDYRLENNSVLKLKSSMRGQFTVWYKVYPKPINENTPDDYEMEIEDIAGGIMPYLMGFRLWIDDDIQRAVIYQNTAEDLIGKLLAAESASIASYEKAYVDTGSVLWLN